MICLFCGPTQATFNKVEHVIPESLGNKTLLLENVVCDKCNQYFSDLENYFIHNHMSSVNRLFTVPKTKKGNPPNQRLVGGKEAHRNLDGTITADLITLDPQIPPYEIVFTEELVTIFGQSDLQDADAKRLSRTLAKFALEIIYLKKGDFALSPEFDPLREYARFGKGVSFIPFLWGTQNEKLIEVFLVEGQHKIDGTFIFAQIYVPGCVYFIPCNRFLEISAFDELAKRFSLNKVNTPGLLKRSPIQFEVNFPSKNGQLKGNQEP